MIKIVLQGPVARKLRLVITALAVMLGVQPGRSFERSSATLTASLEVPGKRVSVPIVVG
jgi:hypothetical protein